MKTIPASPIVSVVILGLSVVACSARHGSEPPTEPAPVRAAVPAFPSAAQDNLPLSERLAREAASRPAGGLSVEAVTAALKRGGVKIGPLRQVLGSTIGARFCMVGQTAPGFGVSICEFRDDPDAENGLATSHRTFDHLIPNRRLERNRATVLTITRPPVAIDADDQAERMAHLFASL